MNVHKLNIDFNSVQPIKSDINIMQFAYGNDSIEFSLLNRGDVFNPEEEFSEASIKIIAPDGNFSERVLWRNGDEEKNALSVTEEASVLSYNIDIFEVYKAGEVNLQICFYAFDETGKISKKNLSPIIYFNVFKSLSSFNLINRKSIDLIDELINEVKALNVTVNYEEYVQKLTKAVSDINNLQLIANENVGEESYDPKSQKAQSGKAVAEAIASIVNSAPETLNTLEELAKALGNDPNFATTIMTLLGGKVDKVDGMGLSSNDYTDEEKANLQQARDDIAELNARADYSENDFKENKEQMKLALNKKVDKVEGKTLSSNDYTDEDKAKLEQAIRDILENRGAISSLEENNDSVHKYLSDVAGVVEEHETRITKNAADVGNLKNQVLELPDKVWVKELVHPVPICEIPATLSTNCEYSFGELTELSLTFPSVANKGDVIYLTFKSGAVATTLAIDTTNTTDVEIVPETNCFYDIFAKFNGSVWLVNYSEYVASEV